MSEIEATKSETATMPASASPPTRSGEDVADAEAHPLRDQPWGAGIPLDVRAANDLIIDALSDPDGTDWAKVRAALVDLWDVGYKDGQLDRLDPEPPECQG